MKSFKRILSSLLLPLLLLSSCSVVSDSDTEPQTQKSDTADYAPVEDTGNTTKEEYDTMGQETKTEFTDSTVDSTVVPETDPVPETDEVTSTPETTSSPETTTKVPETTSPPETTTKVSETTSPPEDPEPKEVGLDITNRTDLVSICYSIWFDPIIDSGIYNIQQALDGTSEWGPVNAFHYWGEPALGYYKSTDKSVIRTHMTMLADAGIDFIIIDNTNGNAKTWGNYYTRMVTNPMTALLDTIIQMRSEGLKTPYVVMWNRVDDDCLWSTAEQTYTAFISKEKYADCWVYWDGKPFMCLTKLGSNSVPLSDFKYKNDLTLRQMTVEIITRKLKTNEWSFLYDLQKPCLDTSGNYEQISIYTARQSTYMSLTSTARGRQGGKTFYYGWKKAFAYHPKVVTLTWWNEWAAQRISDGNGGYVFVDNYTMEYSRDIEPMKGGHGDKYYQWMKQYISAYKAHEDCPKLYD